MISTCYTACVHGRTLCNITVTVCASVRERVQRAVRATQLGGAAVHIPMRVHCAHSLINGVCAPVHAHITTTRNVLSKRQYKKTGHNYHLPSSIIDNAIKYHRHL
jgi:hypothetical protein